MLHGIAYDVCDTCVHAGVPGVPIFRRETVEVELYVRNAQGISFLQVDRTKASERELAHFNEK